MYQIVFRQFILKIFNYGKSCFLVITVNLIIHGFELVKRKLEIT